MSEFHRKVTALLRQHLFEKVPGGKGSHEKWRGGQPKVTLTVPKNLKSRHTANAILKSAGLKNRF
ncbi:type II toxin-antitoxin system HicA family toxin [Yoonia sp. R2331]|uniref:type II toxin-antitoxin system HicA family toxin n=1 Tax=Yoonia sp. R2331 TaxID=3237238 RepID=UPI0034E3BDC0